MSVPAKTGSPAQDAPALPLGRKLRYLAEAAVFHLVMGLAVGDVASPLRDPAIGRRACG